MRERARSRRAARGFTLVELAISAALLGIVSGAVVVASVRGRAAFDTASLQNGVDGDVRRAIDRVAAELVTAGATQLNPNPTGVLGTDALDFRQVTGTAGGAAVWGAQMRIAFEYDTGELDNWLDDDGDGLVDEGRVVLTRDVGGANELRAVLCHDVRELAQGEVLNALDDNGNGVVDERGFNVVRVGDALTIRLTVERTAPGQAPCTRSLQTAVSLRN
jgi:prepilin-type N-terminal cleavage/methylation domain-containing protein